MPDSRPAPPAAGRSRATLLAAVAFLAVLVGAVAALVVPGTDARSAPPAGRRMSQASPAAALGGLHAAGWRTQQRTLVAGGRLRQYLVARPASIAPGRLPVVVLLHGRGMTPAQIVRRSGLLQRPEAVLVAPAGYGRSWNAGACCGAARRARVDDTAFLTRLVADVVASQPAVDPRAVYLVGYSNGGRMAFRMACQRPRLFAAVASVEAVAVYPCPRLARPVPLLVVASTGDPLLRITPSSPRKVVDGYAQPSVGGTVAAWRALERCGATATTRTAGLLTAQRWSCAGGASVALDLYAGGSHAWPPGSATTPSAGEEVWAFLRSTQPAV